MNGLRSAVRKGFLSWLDAANPDVMCLQELKAQPDQLPLEQFEELGYHCVVEPAKVRGYSGVAILSKIPASEYVHGLEIDHFDDEGRVLRADFGSLSVVSVYVPTGSQGEARQHYKLAFLEALLEYMHSLVSAGKNVVLAGDFNISHRSIDLHSPARHHTTPGFLPIERAWVDALLQLGFVDTFRSCNPEPHHYTWWSYRWKSKRQNLGWRIDYQFVSTALTENVQRASILKGAQMSDHSPTLLQLNLPFL